MRWALAAILGLSLLAGCSKPAAEPTAAGEPGTAQTTPAPSNTASAGKWQGEAGDIRLTLVMKPSGEVEWTEETAESKKTWTGKWRDEGEELYLLITKPTNRSALFEKKGDTWVEVSIDNEEAMKGAEIVLKRI